MDGIRVDKTLILCYNIDTKGKENKTMEEIIFLIGVLVGALAWIGYNLAKYNCETVSWIAEKNY